MKRMTGALAVGPILMLCFLLATGCGEEPLKEAKPEKAENFILKDLNGVEYELAKNAGKIVVLNFFNANCGTCQQQTKELVKLNNALSNQGLVVWAVSHGDKALLETFADTYEVSYPILRDTTANLMWWNYYQSDFPTPGVYIIDKEGVILGYSYGQVVSEEELTEAVEPLL